MDNGHEAATKKDLQLLKNDVSDLRSELKNDISELKSEMSGLGNELREAIHDTETRLLSAFYSFGKTNQKQLNELEGNEAAIRGRLGIVEERLLDVEKRLNMPPHQ